jgi:hypothetical protein
MGTTVKILPNQFDMRGFNGAVASLVLFVNCFRFRTR